MGGYYDRVGEILRQHPAPKRPAEKPSGSPSGYWRWAVRVLVAAIVILVVAGALSYVGDFMVLQRRSAAGTAVGQVTVRPYYAVKLKNGKTEFMFQEPRSEKCVNALFPHQNMIPCWYIRRNPERRTDI